jgi:hypothetical protein
MSLAADDAALPDDPEFWAAFVGYVEWGTRLAFHNSQPGSTTTQHAPVRDGPGEWHRPTNRPSQPEDPGGRRTRRSRERTRRLSGDVEGLPGARPAAGPPRRESGHEAVDVERAGVALDPSEAQRLFAVPSDGIAVGATASASRTPGAEARTESTAIAVIGLLREIGPTTTILIVGRLLDWRNSPGAAIGRPSAQVPKPDHSLRIQR